MTPDADIHDERYVHQEVHEKFIQQRPQNDFQVLFLPTLIWR